jgi:hypothetical protein
MRTGLVQVAWSSIAASVARGDFDIGMSGVEDTPARRATFARAYATRVVIMAEGVVVEEGKPAQVLSRPAHPATRQFLASGQLGSGSDRSTSPPEHDPASALR